MEKSQLGSIRCTYAEIFDSKGNKLYSLQARDFCLSKRFPFYRELAWPKQDGLVRVALTEPAAEFIRETSDVQLPDEIWAKECAIDWVKPMTKKRAAIWLGVLAGVLVLFKKYGE